MVGSKHKAPNYIPESLEATLQATLNVIPAYTTEPAENAPALSLAFSSFEK
jgi:hypothetical protein